MAQSGSTSRLLNLANIGRGPARGPASLLRSPGLGRALILKHRLRREDGEVGEALRWRGTATKVIFPFEATDLALGGSSLFVGQPGWTDLLVHAAGATTPSDLVHDQRVLEALDELPSLDPFLVREHLRLRGLAVDDGCLELPERERSQMEQFVAGQLIPLVGLVNAETARAETDAVALAHILLSPRAEERLGPLGATLRLELAAFADGLYAWKGFLYYKWILAGLTAPLQGVLTDIGRLRIVGRMSPDVALRVGTMRGRVHAAVLDKCVDAHLLLGRYDTAFMGLTQEADFRGFREFLQASPAQFLDLGERIGVLSHIATYWRFRFPAGGHPETDVEDALDLLQDFEANLTMGPLQPSAA